MAIQNISKEEATVAAGGAISILVYPDYLHQLYVKYVVIPGGCWPGPSPLLVAVAGV